MCDPFSIRQETRHSLGWVRRSVFPLRRADAAPPQVVGYRRHLVGVPRGRALQVYLSEPFLSEDEERKSFSRSEGVMSLEIAKALNGLGFIVDVIDWQDRTFSPSRHYDVLLGMGPHYERICESLPRSTTKIYFGTGAHWRYENERERARSAQLLLRRGVRIEPRGMTENHAAEVSDAVFALAGNEVILRTWRGQARRLFAVNNCAVPANPLPDLTAKEWLASRLHFLWFGSVFQALRGLDLVLEAFMETPGCQLWVCAPFGYPADRRFFRAYRKELFYSSNIHPVGWIDIRSPTFKLLADLCGFVVSATCTEGMSGSILNCMRAGLIPVVTRSAGIEVGDCGLAIDDETVEGVRRRIADASVLSPDDQLRLARESVRLATGVYTLDAFAVAVRNNLLAVL